MDKVRIDGASNDFASILPELFSLVAELNNFCGTDEGEVEGVEEQQQPLLFVVLQRELLELVGSRKPRLRLEVRSNLADSRTDHLGSHKIY